MMRAIAILVAVALLWPSAAVDTQERSLGKSKPVAASATVYAGSHALLLGVQYSSRAWAPLPAIPKEVESLRLALQSNGFSVTVAAGELTAERIRREVLEFISNFGLDSGNRLLVFFAGHGYTRSDADRDRGYIVPADAPDPERDLRGFLAKAISMDEVNT
jgi:hypothetical protein